MTKSKKATTVAGVKLAMPAPSIGTRATLTESKTRSNVKGAVSGSGAKTAPNEPKLTANPDALLLSILRSSQQTNQVLQQVVAAALQPVRQLGAVQPVVHYGSSDGSHFDGEYEVTRTGVLERTDTGPKHVTGQLGDNSKPSMDRDALKRVRGEGSSGSTLNKISGQKQSINSVRNEVDTARAVYKVLREKLSDVLPSGFPSVSPRDAIVPDDPDCAEDVKTDGILSSTELELMALRVQVRELHEDMAYIADHVRC